MPARPSRPAPKAPEPIRNTHPTSLSLTPKVKRAALIRAKREGFTKLSPWVNHELTKILFPTS